MVVEQQTSTSARLVLHSGSHSSCVCLPTDGTPTFNFQECATPILLFLLNQLDIKPHQLSRCTFVPKRFIQFFKTENINSQSFFNLQHQSATFNMIEGIFYLIRNIKVKTASTLTRHHSGSQHLPCCDSPPWSRSPAPSPS